MGLCAGWLSSRCPSSGGKVVIWGLVCDGMMLQLAPMPMMTANRPRPGWREAARKRRFDRLEKRRRQNRHARP